MAGLRTKYTDSVAFFGNMTPRELIDKFGSPLYVYNEAILRQSCKDLRGLSTYPHFRVHYSAKANSNISLLRIIRQEGLCADAMSPGELSIQLAAGFDPKDLLYVCNNVSAEEMDRAVEEGVLLSLDSLSQVETFGKRHEGSRVMVRVNPGIGDGHSQKVITAGKDTKFGIIPEHFPALRSLLAKYSLHLVGLNQHIGSLFMKPKQYLNAVSWLLDTAKEFPGIEIIDFGGGFGIPYHKYDGEIRLDMADMGKRFDARLYDWCEATGYEGAFYIEPGRYTVAECGLLLGTVTAVKENYGTRYVGTDIGFNVLARPMVYDAFHDVEIYRDGAGPEADSLSQTIVGNICESGDILAKDRMLPLVQENDIIGMLDAGAYGYSMSSSYTQRLQPAEVLIGLDGEAKLIRRRQTTADLLKFFP